MLNGLAQLGGMPLAIFWLGAQKNDSGQTRDNLLVFFAILTIISGVIFAWSGILKLEQIWTALPLAVAYGIGVVTGARGFHKASEEAFRRISYLVIGASVALALPLFDGWLR